MKVATNTPQSASVPPLDLGHTGKLPALLNAMPAQPKPATAALLTAARRGTEWMTRYGCPTWCVMNHDGEDGAPGWHQGPTITMDAPPLQDDDRAPAEVGPLFAARINQVNESPEIFGIETKLWLDIDEETYELGLAETDRFIERMERFLPRLKAMRDHLATASQKDQPKNDEAFQVWLTTPLAPKAGE